jgi:hypothetical protein
VDRSVSRGIGTIAISLAIVIAMDILVVKGMITQANANYWLIAAAALLFLGIYLVIRGTLLKSKPTLLVSSAENPPDVVKEAARVQLDAANRLLMIMSEPAMRIELFVSL